MFTFVGLYAGATFSNCDLIIGGASAPHPSSSAFASLCVRTLVLANGLKPPETPDLVGLKTGFEATGGGGPDCEAVDPPPEYLAPEASETFCTILSGVRSRSDRAVIWTW